MAVLALGNAAAFSLIAAVVRDSWQLLAAAGLAAVRHCLWLVFPLPFAAETLPFAAEALPFAAETLPLACLSTAFRAEALPLPDQRDGM